MIQRRRSIFALAVILVSFAVVGSVCAENRGNVPDGFGDRFGIGMHDADGGR